LRAEDGEDRLIGTVKAIHNFGAGDVIEIEAPDGSDLLLSFTRESVPVVDVAAGRIVVAVPPDDRAEERHGVE
jgi:16S rRNA processing protein RimM